ncbi:carboxylesterase [Micrococcus sp.]|uniref:alpha/beta hydrolase n=1 Tax=Micrococcus sp. TaxID=1271 RepID=UPI0026DB65A2|nr:alpha/beta fold hydrolase [Micrococcus sp.]MDO4240324.1 alpha/beta fold hydrolase [Micrococcus sp.]
MRLPFPLRPASAPAPRDVDVPEAQRPFRLPATGRPDVAVVVLHGFTSGPASVRAWAEGLAAEGVAVRVPLLPGHGTRWEDLAATGADEIRAAVRAEVDAALAGHHHVAVAGISMGGALTLDAAAHRPVAAALVVNPALRFGNPVAHAAPLLRHVVPSLPAIAGDIADPDAREIAYERTPLGGVAAVGRIQRAAERGLGRITSPVTVFRSARDAVVPEASHRALLRGLTRAPVEVVPLPRSRHVATLDLDLPLLIEASRAAVARAVAPR